VGILSSYLARVVGLVLRWSQSRVVMGAKLGERAVGTEVLTCCGGAPPPCAAWLACAAAIFCASCSYCQCTIRYTTLSPPIAFFTPLGCIRCTCRILISCSDDVDGGAEGRWGILISRRVQGRSRHWGERALTPIFDVVVAGICLLC
jgi:hypothetical protein